MQEEVKQYSSLHPIRVALGGPHPYLSPPTHSAPPTVPHHALPSVSRPQCPTHFGDMLLFLLLVQQVHLIEHHHHLTAGDLSNHQTLQQGREGRGMGGEGGEGDGRGGRGGEGRGGEGKEVKGGEGRGGEPIKLCKVSACIVHVRR